MPIDPFSDELLSPKAAAETLPKHANTSTVWRWIRDGMKGVKLDAVSIGGKWFTTKDALAEFISKTTAAAQARPRRCDAIAAINAESLEDEAAEADAEVARLGFG